MRSLVVPTNPEDPVTEDADSKAEDPRVQRILDMLERDILSNPEKLKPIDHSLIRRMVELSDGVEVDLDNPLSPHDE